MPTHVTRVCCAVGAALTMFGATAADASSASARSPRASHRSGAPGSQLWVQRYNGPGNGTEMLYPAGAPSMAVSPDGSKVFLTGGSKGTNSGEDYVSFAYNTATGARLWVERYNGPGNGFDVATSVAASPSGGTVFVTGSSEGTAAGADYSTVAYNAATGAQLWVRRYNGPANRNEGAVSIAVDASGARVFVTGTSEGATLGREDYATVAYNAATGAQLWVRRYNGPANSDDNASSLSLSPNGATVFVTGTSKGATSHSDYATVAYRASTGARLWVRRFSGPANSNDEARSVKASPNGVQVFVTGYSSDPNSVPTYATVAYRAATGAQLWVRRYQAPGGHPNFAESVTVGRNGAEVFVAGTTATIAYRAATGAQQWLRRESAFVGVGGGSTPPPTVAVSRDGTEVFVAGTTRGPVSGEDYTTFAYNAATGARLWSNRYNGPAKGNDSARSVAVGPNGRTVFVNGVSQGSSSGPDFATVAYRA